jgi:hypothetical protein
MVCRFEIIVRTREFEANSLQGFIDLELSPPEKTPERSVVKKACN